MSVSACEDVASGEGTVVDGAAFAARAQQLTNLASAEGWLGLYHPDAVADWIVDGARERHERIDAIRPAAMLMAELWRRHRFRVRKHLRCATDECVVLTFGGRGCVTGAEIWTFRDGLVVHHWLSVHLDARPRTSQWAQFRVLITAPASPFPRSVCNANTLGRKVLRQPPTECWHLVHGIRCLGRMFANEGSHRRCQRIQRW